MLKLEFSDTTAEGLNAQVKDYMSKVKGSRGGKAGGDDAADTGAAQTAPAPIMPNTGAQFGQIQTAPSGFTPGGAGFAPPAGSAAPGGGFPAAGAQIGPSPEVAGLVDRISKRIDWCLQPPPAGGGQPVEKILEWFRAEALKNGVDASQYSLDQIKQSALPRFSVPALTQIAQLSGA